jgi:hypothetical protein
MGKRVIITGSSSVILLGLGYLFYRAMRKASRGLTLAECER